jgi:hypothetical protein
MLCDENPFNDTRAYLQLWLLLWTAGDYYNSNAAAAASLIQFQHFSDPEAKTILLDVNPLITARVHLYDGFCKIFKFSIAEPSWERLYKCRECLDVSFCEDCYSIHKNQGLPQRICDAKHNFVQVVPVPQESIGVAAKLNKENRSVDVQKDWLENLRKEWQ